jgi:Ca2+-binding EF-hand superfamily protein
MDSKQFSISVLDALNNFRANPTSISKKCENLKKALSRARSTDPMIKDIDNYMYLLKSSDAVHSLKLSENLCEAAENELDIIEQGEFNFETDQNEFESRMKNFCKGFKNVFYVADQGSDEPEDVISRVLLNKKDTKKKNRKLLLDEQIYFMGVAHRIIDETNTIVLIFVNDMVEQKQGNVVKRDRGNVDELKQAFDLFDVNKIGKIDIREALNAMKVLQFDKKNPTLYEVMKGLDIVGKKSPMIDFDTFVNHILENVEDVESEDGLRRIFDLFVDDPHSDTITLSTLKRICIELGETTKVEELKDMMQRASVTGTELTFEEFCDFMRSKNEKSE